MRITQHKIDGVKIQFDNGLVLSTIWGYGTYSDNYDNETKDEYGFGNHKEGSKTVEFMFTRGDDKLIKKLCKKFGDDENPSGYIPVSQWLKMIAHIQRLQSKHIDK